MDLSMDQPLEHVAVRIFTLCDHASVPPDGKIYIHGAGVHQLFVPQIPGPLRTLFLVVRLSIPWHMLGEPHTVNIRALDLDRQPIGPPTRSSRRRSSLESRLVCDLVTNQPST